jgi:hypothetical protein
MVNCAPIPADPGAPLIAEDVAHPPLVDVTKGIVAQVTHAT